MSSSSSSSGASGGMGGNGGNATGGMGGAGGSSTGGMGGSGGSPGCTPGSTDFCYSGPAGTEIVGVCKAGLKTCLADGTYGPCMGEVIPSAEDCGSMGDENCDGAVNENCACVPNMTAPCYGGPMGTLNIGDCKAGVQTCNGQGTAYGPCIGEIVPLMESCSLPGDEDCDGQINESGAGCICAPNTTAPCYGGPMGTQNVGECKGGIRTCNGQGTAYGPCIGEIVPQMETCALPGDEDCDGQVNESGAMCVCIPNSMTSCYTGPMGTLNVGECKAGMQLCNAQGTAYGACTGEVIPVAESCNTAGDDDCDGQVNEQCNAVWTKRIGSVLDEDIFDVAVDSAGNIIVVGQFQGMVDFGGGTFTTPNGNSDIFVAKYDAAGNHLWSKQYGANGIDGARSVAVDATGNVLVTGSFQSTVDFGGGPFASVGGSHDIFVLVLDSAGGYLISRAFGGPGGDEGTGVIFDAGGNGIIAGHMTGTIDFGGGPITSAGSDDGFVVKFSSLGFHVWSKRFGDANAQNIKDIAVDAAGDIYLTGSFAGMVDFGGGAITSLGSTDSMLVKLSSAGNHVWTRQIGGLNAQNGASVTVDSLGNPIVTGFIQGSVDFGLGALTSAGLSDIFVAKYNSNNVAQWAKIFGDANDQSAMGIKTDAQNNVIVVGRTAGTVDFGGGASTAAGLNDIFVTKFAPAGTYTWSRRIGDPLEQWARAVAVDNANNIITVGRFQGMVDFGTGMVTSAGGADGFIVKYGP
jgi:hypothetical protein